MNPPAGRRGRPPAGPAATRWSGPSTGSRSSVLSRRCDGTFTVDEWGLDPDLVGFVSPLLDLRWRIDVEGAERLPGDGPALLVHNRRFGLTEPVVVAHGIRSAIDRFVRPAGVPDVAPIGPGLRALGGVLHRTDEVAGLLRAGEVVAVPLGRELRLGPRAGRCDPTMLAAAVEAGSAVHPVAVTGRELGRRWQVVVGDELALPDRTDPSARAEWAAAEWAAAARLGVQRLLDPVRPTGR